jgi:hypothetical protein
MAEGTASGWRSETPDRVGSEENMKVMKEEIYV